MSDAQPLLGTQRRVLLVCSGVLRHGPITLEDLSDKIGLPQSATYRALQQLTAEGWVHRSVGPSGFVASYALRDLFQDGSYGFPFVETARDLVKRAGLLPDLQFDFAVLDPDGAVRFLDSTERGVASFLPLRLSSSFFGRTAVCALDRDRRAAFLRRYLARADAQERRLAQDPGFGRRFRFPSKHRLLWGASGQSLAFAIRAPGRGDQADPVFGAIRLRAKADSALGRADLLQATRRCLLAHGQIADPDFDLCLSAEDVQTPRA